MTNLFLETLLYDVFKAQGATDAAGLARRAAESFDRDKRDAQIYELRARLTEECLAIRFSISVRRVQQIVKEQMLLRKSIA